MISKFINSARKVVPMPENRYLNAGGIEIFTYNFSQECFTTGRLMTINVQ